MKFNCTEVRCEFISHHNKYIMEYVIKSKSSYGLFNKFYLIRYLLLSYTRSWVALNQILLLSNKINHSKYFEVHSAEIKKDYFFGINKNELLCYNMRLVGLSPCSVWAEPSYCAKRVFIVIFQNGRFFKNPAKCEKRDVINFYVRDIDIYNLHKHNMFIEFIINPVKCEYRVIIRFVKAKNFRNIEIYIK